jgi:hypothetical protein
MVTSIFWNIREYLLYEFIRLVSTNMNKHNTYPKQTKINHANLFPVQTTTLKPSITGFSVNLNGFGVCNKKIASNLVVPR